MKVIYTHPTILLPCLRPHLPQTVELPPLVTETLARQVADPQGPCTVTVPLKGSLKGTIRVL